MAIEISRTSIPDEKEIFTDLKLIAKGAGNQATYGPRTPELLCFEFTKDTIIIPMVYALKKFGIKLKDRKEYDMQVSAVTFRPGQNDVYNEAITILRNTSSVFLRLNCSYGKTFLALNIIGAMKQRTLILVHRTFLAGQFYTEAQKVIPDQLKIIEDNNVDDKTPGSVFVCTDIRARTLPESFRKTINFIVIDEAKHFMTESRISSLLAYKPKYTMGLCADWDRTDGYEKALELFFGKVIFRKSEKPFIVWKFMTDFQPDIVKQAYSRGGRQQIDWNAAMQSLADNQERNEFIVSLCLLRKIDKILILVQYIKHVETLRDMLRVKGENVNTFCGSQNTYKNCRILIATYSKAEVGFDDSNLCDDFDGQRFNLLIFGAFYKKEIEQAVGRIFRCDEPEVFDIVDDYSTLKKHSKTRDKFYISRKGVVNKPEQIYSMTRMANQY